MVGVAGLLRLVCWWRQRDASARERGDGNVFPDGEDAAAREADGGNDDDVVAADVGTTSTDAPATARGRSRRAGGADTDGEERP